MFHFFFDENESVWEKHFTNSERFFTDVHIAKDDGFSEVSREKFWYPMRYFWAVVTVVWLGMNFFYVWVTNMGYIRAGNFGPTGNSRRFLFTDDILDFICQCFHLQHPVQPETWLVGVEVFLWLYNLFRGVVAISVWAFGKPSIRWHACASFFWVIIPQWATLSAMTLLYYVTPQVFTSQLENEITTIRAKFKARPVSLLVHFLGFLLGRLLLGIVGFDAFLMKFRMTCQYLVVEDVYDLFRILLFVNQVLGVVQINWMIQLRLFHFVFGGEDSILDSEADAKRRTWLALLAKEIWSVFPVDKFLAIMLSFSDQDFQLLVLDEDDHEDEPSARLATSCTPTVRGILLDENGQLIAENTGTSIVDTVRSGVRRLAVRTDS